jgi:hypothetical protein
LIPLTILGANGLVALARAATWRAAVTVIAATAISGVTLGYAIAGNTGLQEDNATVAKAVAEQGRSLTFVSVYPSYLQHPSSVIANATPPGGRTVYALPRGGDDFAVISNYPGRALFRLSLLGSIGQRPHKNFQARLERLSVVSAKTLAFDLHTNAPENVRSARLVLTVGDQQINIPMVPGSSSQLKLTLSAGPGTTGLTGSKLALNNVRPGRDGMAVLTLFVVRSHGPETVNDRERLALVNGPNGTLRVIAPTGLVKVLGKYPEPAMSLQLASH